MPTLPSVRDADAHTMLSVYLSDHLAGAVVGGELARRTLRSNRGTELGDFLRGLVRDIEEDRGTLERVMRNLGVAGSRAKQLAGIAAERAGRLKLNGQLLGYSPLSRLVELEGLCAGVETKLNLWRSLSVALPPEALPADVDVDELVRRAEEQREQIEEWRQRAAREALAGAEGAAGS